MKRMMVYMSYSLFDGAGTDAAFAWTWVDADWSVGRVLGGGEDSELVSMVTPGGRKTLNPWMSTGWPANSSWTRCNTAAVDILCNKRFVNREVQCHR